MNIFGVSLDAVKSRKVFGELQIASSPLKTPPKKPVKKCHTAGGRIKLKDVSFRGQAFQPFATQQQTTPKSNGLMAYSVSKQTSSFIAEQQGKVACSDTFGCCISQQEGYIFDPHNYTTSPLSMVPSEITQMVCGSSFCAILSKGHLFITGGLYNLLDQETMDPNTFYPLSTKYPITCIAATDEAVLFVNTKGQGYIFGNGFSTSLTPTRSKKVKPVALSLLERKKKVEFVKVFGSKGKSIWLDRSDRLWRIDATIGSLVPVHSTPTVIATMRVSDVAFSKSILLLDENGTLWDSGKKVADQVDNVYAMGQDWVYTKHDAVYNAQGLLFNKPILAVSDFDLIYFS